MSQGLELVSGLIERGVTVHVQNMGVLDNSPASKMLRAVFFAFAEFERDMIRERTAEGKAARKAELGDKFREGRPRLEIPGLEGAIRAIKAGRETVTGAARRLGVHRGTIYNRMAES